MTKMVYDTDERDGVEDEYYTDWLSDNLINLKDEFIEMYANEFAEYCRSQFNVMKRGGN